MGSNFMLAPYLAAISMASVFPTITAHFVPNKGNFQSYP